MQNGVFVVAPNKGGIEQTEGDRPFFGNSVVFNPMGELIEKGPSSEGPATFFVTLDLNEVYQHGKRYTFFRDRRPELYGSLGDVYKHLY